MCGGFLKKSKVKQKSGLSKRWFHKSSFPSVYFSEPVLGAFYRCEGEPFNKITHHATAYVRTSSFSSRSLPPEGLVLSSSLDSEQQLELSWALQTFYTKPTISKLPESKRFSIFSQLTAHNSLFHSHSSIKLNTSSDLSC